MGKYITEHYEIVTGSETANLDPNATIKITLPATSIALFGIFQTLVLYARIEKPKHILIETDLLDSIENV